MKSNIPLPQTQRALVLQGGGALGAYEVGVLKVLCNKLIEGAENSQKDEPLFDVIAGTSMGAMNAAVLVSNVVNRNKTWGEAVKELETFWTDTEKGLSSNPDWWWNDENYQDKNTQNKVKSSPEAARKYYSVKEYLKRGTPRVCTAPVVRLDAKFGDEDNSWLCYTSKPLEDTIVRYSKDPDNKKLRIATSWEKRQPRLLVISVDVAEGKTITFDSYYKEEEGSENSLYECDGITIDHVMASGTLPEFYDFRDIGDRKFWDGAVLSNTPFRELLQAHQAYWMSKDKEKIPDLEVYIVNVHPSKIPINKIPEDYDGVKDRHNDIKYGDRTSHYDEKIAHLITDYTNFIAQMKDLAEKAIDKVKDDNNENIKEKKKLQERLKAILETNTINNDRRDEPRTYEDLMRVGFKLTKVERIEPERYDDSIFLKGADFTSKTIRSLIEKGKKDALKVLK